MYQIKLTVTYLYNTISLDFDKNKIIFVFLFTVKNNIALTRHVYWNIRGRLFVRKTQPLNGQAKTNTYLTHAPATTMAI